MSAQIAIGQTATVSKADYSEATGKVVSVNEHPIVVFLGTCEYPIRGEGMETKVTIIDENGKEHSGSII